MDQANFPDSKGPDLLFIQAKDAALRLLAYRARSEAEVRRRLSRRYPPDVTEKAIHSLRETGQLDDESFSRFWVQNRQQHRPRSQKVIRQELLRLGVSGDLVRETLEGFNEEANAYRAGRKVSQKLAFRSDSEEQFRQRLGEYLKRRGFGYTVTAETVNQLWRELGADALHCKDHAENDEEQPP
jgi:regulatory protein